jgi:acetyl esterase
MTQRAAEEGVLDPWVADWVAANPAFATPFDDLSPENLQLARSPIGPPSKCEIAEVVDRQVEGVPVRIYRDEGPNTGVVVYLHGGGFVMGSIALMDNVARQLAHTSNAVVVSVGYRLAPEHPYPAGLDDCETVVRWAQAHAHSLGVGDGAVAVAGESAGGNLSAAVALRLLESDGAPLAGQVLIYPALAGSEVYPSAVEFDGLIINRTAKEQFWAAYTAGRDLDKDPCAAPLRARSLRGLPPALIVLGGCDMLRDEGRAYANRLREDGVVVDEVCYPGQPHGFINFEFPAADPAFEHIGAWLRATLAGAV